MQNRVTRGVSNYTCGGDFTASFLETGEHPTGVGSTFEIALEGESGG